MDVRNCKNCGRLFNVLANERLCPACRQAMEDKFQDVKNYINEHKGASIDEVSRENDVSVKQIKQWVREERLSFSEDSMEGIECEKCGKLIRTGRFCDNCRKTMTNDLMSVMDKPKLSEPPKSSKDKDRDRMRFL
ncbi:MAG: flagellar protein [Blautia sp.]|nr:flagellar protein [Blautia sp.]